MNPDGSISLKDRSKDIIISGGEVNLPRSSWIKKRYLTNLLSQNASSLAIEQELASHPHVLEVSVVARQHIKWGERPMAFVTLHPQHAATWKGRHHDFAADLKRHAKSRLPGFACPEWVEVVPELPVSIYFSSASSLLNCRSCRKHQQARFSRRSSEGLLPSSEPACLW